MDYEKPVEIDGLELTWPFIKSRLQHRDFRSYSEYEQYFKTQDMGLFVHGGVSEGAAEEKKLFEFFVCGTHSDERFLRIISERLQGTNDIDRLLRGLLEMTAHDHFLYHGSDGMMKGLEARLTQLAVPKSIADAPYYQKHPEDVPRRASSLFSDLSRRFEDYLSFPAVNPYSPCLYLVDFYFDCLRLGAEEIAWDGLLDLFAYLVHFIEPRDSGNESSARRLRDVLLERFSTMERRAIRRRLEQVASPLGRFAKYEDPASIDWSMRLNWAKTYHSSDRNLLEPRVLHGKSHPRDLMARVADTYHRLGFSENGWNPECCRRVDIGSILSPQFKAELGYDSKASVPVRWFRIHTTPNYQVSVLNETKLFIDLFEFREPSGDEVPSFLFLPRFGEFYRTYAPMQQVKLNERIVRRILLDEHGLITRRYRDRPTLYDGFHKRNREVVEPLYLGFEALDPYKVADYYPVDVHIAPSDEPDYPNCA